MLPHGSRVLEPTTMPLVLAAALSHRLKALFVELRQSWQAPIALRNPPPHRQPQLVSEWQLS